MRSIDADRLFGKVIHDFGNGIRYLEIDEPLNYYPKYCSECGRKL